jgi:hypothetical protein
MARNKARRTLFQLSRSRFERGVDLGEVPLRRRAQPSESAPATIEAMTRSPEGSPIRGAQESPGRSTSTRRVRSSAGCWPSSASAGGCASERGRQERLRVLGDGRDEEVKEEEPQVAPSSPRHFRGENTAIRESGQCACLVIALPCPRAIQMLGRRCPSDDVRAQRVPKRCFIRARARPRPDVGAQFTFLSHDHLLVMTTRMMLPPCRQLLHPYLVHA